MNMRMNMSGQALAAGAERLRKRRLAPSRSVEWMRSSDSFARSQIRLAIQHSAHGLHTETRIRAEFKRQR